MLNLQDISDIGPAAVRMPVLMRATRLWGHYEVLMCGARWRVKRLTIEPGKSTSFQRHIHRSEHWLVVEGMAKICQRAVTPIGDLKIGDRYLATGHTADIDVGDWHQIMNPGTEPLVMIEVWMGGDLRENDIERANVSQTADTNRPEK
jgi:mannose-1-phosphate guanylyltransferase / mannose-6-phosphate isomerase